MPGALVPGPRPVDSDLLHCVSSPRPATPSRRGRWRAARPWWPGSSGKRYGSGPTWRVTRRWLAGGISRRGRSVTRRCYRPAGGVRGSGPAAGPSRRPRSGWRRRACPGRGSRAFDRVQRHHEIAGDALVGPARGEQAAAPPAGAGQRLGQARRRGRGSPPGRGRPSPPAALRPAGGALTAAPGSAPRQRTPPRSARARRPAHQPGHVAVHAR
jgi:hypothetical protein